MAIKKHGRRIAWTLILCAVAASAADGDVPSTYLLGPEDTISVVVPEAEELSFQNVRIAPDGSVRLPQVGGLQAAGLTVADFEAALERRLARYMHDPQAIVTVSEFRSQPVSVTKAAKSGVEISLVSGTPTCSDNSAINRPVASEVVFLKGVAPRSSALT